MNLGTIFHHKYFNGIAPSDIASSYQREAIKYFQHFGMFGTGIMKMIAQGPDPEKDYQWRNTDLLVEFGEENNLQIYFNTVVTGRLNTFPDWYIQLNSSEKVDALERHVRAVIDRYKGRVEFFKLVNEATAEEDGDFLGSGRKKAELISLIFKWAVDEYKEGKYMLNEYGPLFREDIRSDFIQLATTVQNDGARIDLIGLQGHSGYNPRPFQLPTDEMLNDSLDAIYKGVGEIPLSITEFDLSYKNSVSDPFPGSEIDPNLEFTSDGKRYTDWFQYQGYAYQHFVELCRSKGFVESFFFWKFNNDPDITWEREGCGLVDKNLKEKAEMRNFLDTLG